MSTLGWTLLGMGFVLMALALLVIDKGLRQAASERAMDRLDHAIRHKKKVTLEEADPLKKKFLPRWLTDTLLSAGIEPSERNIALMAGGLLLPAIVVSAAQGLMGLLGTLMIEVMLLTLWLLSQQRARKKKIIEQLPVFIDAVSRISGVGYSLNIAYNQAVEMAEQPLKNTLAVTVDMQQAGLELDEAMARLAMIYKLTEFRLMSSIIALAMNYGGKSDILLGRLGQYLRDRDQHYKEMLAMSSEARMSAVILAGLTPFVVGLMLVVNPEYLLTMWRDASGAGFLMAAGSLQVVGMYLMYRMVRNF
jgi:tight adherence protein B